MVKNTLKSIYIKGAAVLILTIVGLVTVSTVVRAERFCNGLESKGVYKTADSRSVWYVSEQCTKRPILNPAVYFSHFDSWKAIKVVSAGTLNGIRNDELGFLPWGSLRDFLNGSLVKTVDDPKIYLILSGVRYPIASEEVFYALGFKFRQVEDVMPEVLGNYNFGNTIYSATDYPQDLVFKYSDGPELYLLDRQSDGSLRRRYINSFLDVRRDYRVDNIAELGAGINILDSAKGGIEAGDKIRYSDGDVQQIQDQQQQEEENQNVEQNNQQNTEPQEPEVSTPNIKYCGNGEVDPYETCDPTAPGQYNCNAQCTGYNSQQTNTNEQNQNQNNSQEQNNSSSNTTNQLDPRYCGNGEVDPYETCDPTAPGQSNCNAQCTGYNSSSNNNTGTTTNPPTSNNNNTNTNSTPTYSNASCSLDSFGFTGKTYYFCDCGAGASSSCVPGDATLKASQDPANPGRSMTDAKNLLNSMSAGDKVALCRGGSFTTDQVKWVNTNCTASNRCGLVDYQPAAANSSMPIPILTTSLHGVAFEDGGNSDADGGYVVANINLKSAQPSSPGDFGVFFYNDADDVNLCGLKIEDYGIAVHVGGNNTVNTGNGKSERIVLKNSSILNNTNMGWLGGCDDCVISNNIFDNNGFRPERGGIYSHSIYVSGTTNRMIVSQNNITKSVHANGTNSCHGAPIVVHGHHDAMKIEKNLIEEAPGTATQQCWGIAVGPGYNYPESFTNIQVNDNIIKYVGNRSVALDQCENCSQNNNQITLNSSYMPYVNP